MPGLFCNLVGLQARELHPTKQAAAGFGDVQRRHHIEQRGLACTIGADEPKDFALADFKAHILEGLQPAKAFAQPLGDEQGLAWGGGLGAAVMLVAPSQI